MSNRHDGNATGISQPAGEPYIVVLGTAQDGGYPSAGCQRSCCKRVWRDPALRRNAACLAIVDPASLQRWLIDCTPDFREQLHQLDEIYPLGDSRELDGILLTHAHTGHYAGLIQLGREMLATGAVPVYAAPQMFGFLLGNEPWRSLVDQGHISLKLINPGQLIKLNDRISVTPMAVPHRNELSETVGYRICGPSLKVVYIPDIDTWDGMDPPIELTIAGNDLLYLDGTFFSADELSHRSMASVPHPCIQDSMARFSVLPARDRRKIVFTHFNHTNPVLDTASMQNQVIHDAGMRAAFDGETRKL